MSWSLRRALLVVLAVGGLAVPAFLQVAWGQKIALPAQAEDVAQPGQPDTEPRDPTEFSESLTLPRDPELAKKIEAIHDYVAIEDWKQATELIQLLIDIPADVFAQLPRTGPDGKTSKIWTSVRGEAKRLLATLPEKGKDFYQVTYGPDATLMLEKARESGNPSFLAEVMRRFLYTEAGGQATALLATYYLDRGDYTAAALCFKRLIERDGISKVEKNVLFKAAYAFHQIADSKNEDEVWKELNTRGGAVRLGGRNQSVEDLQRFVGGLVRTVNEFNRTTWPIFGGNSARNGKAEGDTAFMDALWRKPLTENDATRDKIQAASTYILEKQFPLLGAFYPITATITRDGQKAPIVVFRSFEGLHAYHLKTGQRIWTNPSWYSLDRMYRDHRKVGVVSNWIDQVYFGNSKQRPSIFFDNSTLGALSSDGSLLFAVDDLAVPPPPQASGGRPGVPGGAVAGNTALGDMLESNRLQAYSLTTGKLVWEQGGKEGGAAELKESYFLGPPLPVAGKLYALIERQTELKLAELDALTGKLLKLQPLAKTTERMSADINRRINAAHLSYGEGMLICPTNAGAVLCIDVLENSLVWAYPYQEKTQTTAQPQPQPGIIRRPIPNPAALKPVGTDGWKATAPIILGGKVYFTAPDAQHIHCVNLADGTSVWTYRRTDDDLYMAGVFNGKVLIVGRRGVRALDALKGTVAWNVPTGMPSGLGICSGNLYYLPLREGLETKEPEIVAIDLDRGTLHAHTKSRKKEVPGNLVFFEGNVVSQTTSEIAVYPQLRVKLAQIDERIRANENDPIGLIERGELRLDRGDLPGAVSDLNRALGQPDIPKDMVGKAREKLFETLTDYLQRDFNGAEKYLDTYKELCSVEVPPDATAEVKKEKEAESRRRQANRLCLLAKGREAQRRLEEAFDLYQEFASLAVAEERITVVDEPAVECAPDVWAHGRIAAMMAGASEEERKPLETKVQKQWEGMKTKAGIPELRKFVGVFGSQFPAGKEARLALADKLIDSGDADALLDAERHLDLLRGKGEDRNLAGRAVECLARLTTKKALLEDAAYFYDLLGRRYGDVVLPDGRTGADAYNDLASDKRFLLQLDRVAKIPAATRWKVAEDRNSYPAPGNTYQLEQIGEQLPFFERWQLALRLDTYELKLLDKLSDTAKLEERPIRRLELGAYNIQNITAQMQQHAYNTRNYNQPRLGFQSIGHLAVLQLGPMVYAVDTVGKRVLWERNLLAGTGPAAGPRQPTNPVFGTEPDGTLTMQLSDGFVQRLGTPALVDSGVVCLQTRDALLALDPITGRVLWTRSDVRASSRIFADAGHVFVVEMSPTNANAAVTRVFRLTDGVTVPKIPDFTPIYNKKTRMVGRNILYVEPGPAGGQVAKLYDPLAGKDVWSRNLLPNAILLQPASPELFGTIEVDPAKPLDGKVTVTNLNTQKDVLTSTLTMAHMDKMLSVGLVSDGNDYYVLGNGPVNNNIAAFGGMIQPPIMLNTGMRALPVNGYVYAFDGETGKRRWYNRVENQTLILDRVEDLPVLLFASRYQTWVGGVGRQQIQMLAVKTILKGNGKLVYDNDSDPTTARPDGKFQPLPQGMSFHSLHLNPAEGKFEFVGYNLKITHKVDIDAK